MDRKYFLDCLEFTNRELCNLEVHRAYNSTGSNICFKFGRQKEEYLPNGRKTLASEWTIWLCNASWRITQYGQYIVGSNDDREIISQTIQGFVGICFVSVEVVSCYLDVFFEFENGYKVETFFNWCAEDQWLLLLSNASAIVIDCSSQEAIESIQHLAQKIEIKNRYKALDLFFLNAEVKDVVFGERALSQIICTEDFSVDLGLSAWRLEKKGQYQEGRIDYYFGSSEGKGRELEDKLLDLIGQKIQSVSIDVSGMDLKLDFIGGYVFEVFSHSKAGPWKILHKNEVVLHAKVE